MSTIPTTPTTQTPPDPNALLLGGGGRWTKFEAHGDKVVGTIVALETRQATDIDGVPKYFDSGDVRWEVIVTLQTGLSEDGDDDGVRLVALGGSSKYASKAKAAADAMRAAGATELAQDGEFGIAYVGDGEPLKRGHTAPKLYAATYTAPTAKADLSGIWDDVDPWDDDAA